MVFMKLDTKNVLVSTWFCIIGRRIIGHIFNNNLISKSYLNLLQNDLVNVLDAVPLYLNVNKLFGKNVAPAHNGNIVANYLNNRGHILWLVC